MPNAVMRDPGKTSSLVTGINKSLNQLPRSSSNLLVAHFDTKDVPLARVFPVKVGYLELF